MIFLMHGSSVASIITLLDLTGAARTAARGTFHFSESYLLAIVLYMMLMPRRHHSCNPPNGKILPPPLANGKLIKMDSRSWRGNDKKMRAHCLFYAESHSIDKSNAPHIKLGRSRNT